MSAKTDVLFAATIEKYLYLSGLKTRNALAPRIQIHPRTLTRKINNPDTFTVAELRRVKRVLQIPTEEMEVVLE